MIVVAKPSFIEPKVVSFFSKDAAVGTNCEYTYPSTLAAAKKEVVAAVKKGAKPTGDETRRLLAK